MLNADMKEVVGIAWDILEPVLRGWDVSLRGSRTKNRKLEAWLSDCALAIMESDEDSILYLALSLAEEEPAIPSDWAQTFTALAFRRRVAWDIGEDVDPPKATEAQRLGTDRFWDKVPASHSEECDPAENAEEFEVSLRDWSLCTPKDSSLSKVIHSFCQYPNLVNTEKAKLAGISKTAFYDNLESLRTRLACHGLLELACSSVA